MRKLTLIMLLSLLTFGCKAVSQPSATPSASSPPVPNTFPKRPKPAFRTDNGDNTYSLDLSGFLRDDIQNLIDRYHPKHPEILRKIAEQDEKFIGLIEPCKDVFNPVYAGFNDPIKVSDQKYIIVMNCAASSMRVSAFALFLYTEPDRIQLPALEITTFDEQENGVYKKKLAFQLIGRVYYDEIKEELLIRGDPWRCDERMSARRNCSDLAKYKFENDKLVLEEFSVIRTDENGQVTILKRIYP